MQNMQHGGDAYAAYLGVSDGRTQMGMGWDGRRAGERAAKANIISAEETRASDGRRDADAATMDCRM